MIELAVARWAAWIPGVEGADAWRAWARVPQAPSEPGAPSASEIPALLRRRCDALSRALLHVAGECCEAASTPVEGDRDAPLASRVATVFATRFGPLGAIVENLDSLAAGRSPSPMTFSHAVHNTALGLYSIWTQNRAPGSALAAGAATFAHGWLEAALLLQREPARPVLLVAGDAALPPALLPLAGAEPPGPHALALLLRAPRAGDGERAGEIVRFGLASGVALESPAPEMSAARAGAALPPPLEFLRWWIAGEKPLALDCQGRTWRWERG